MTFALLRTLYIEFLVRWTFCIISLRPTYDFTFYADLR